MANSGFSISREIPWGWTAASAKWDCCQLLRTVIWIPPSKAHSKPFSTCQHKIGAQLWSFLGFVLNKEKKLRDPAWNTGKGTISLIQQPNGQYIHLQCDKCSFPARTTAFHLNWKVFCSCICTASLLIKYFRSKADTNDLVTPTGQLQYCSRNIAQFPQHNTVTCPDSPEPGGCTLLRALTAATCSVTGKLEPSAYTMDKWYSH